MKISLIANIFPLIATFLAGTALAQDDTTPTNSLRGSNLSRELSSAFAAMKASYDISKSPDMYSMDFTTGVGQTRDATRLRLLRVGVSRSVYEQDFSGCVGGCVINIDSEAARTSANAAGLPLHGHRYVLEGWGGVRTASFTIYDPPAPAPVPPPANPDPAATNHLPAPSPLPCGGNICKQFCVPLIGCTEICVPNVPCF